MQVKKQRSQISIPGSLRQFLASHRPPLLVSIMAELSNKAALPVEGHSSPAPGTRWGRCEDKRQQRLASKPHFRWESKSQKPVFKPFCPPPPLALESLSYNRKIVSLLLFPLAQHWAPFPEHVFKLILKRDCFPMRQWGGICALWHAMACLLALLCSTSKLGMLLIQMVSLVRLLALGDTVIFLFFSGETVTHNTRVSQSPW